MEKSGLSKNTIEYLSGNLYFLPIFIVLSEILGPNALDQCLKSE